MFHPGFFKWPNHHRRQPLLSIVPTSVSYSFPTKKRSGNQGINLFFYWSKNVSVINLIHQSNYIEKTGPDYIRKDYGTWKYCQVNWSILKKRQREITMKNGAKRFSNTQTFCWSRLMESICKFIVYIMQLGLGHKKPDSIQRTRIACTMYIQTFNEINY